MNILFLLIPISLLLGLAGLIGFYWSIRSDQYEDLKGDGSRILDDKYDLKPKQDKSST